MSSCNVSEPGRKTQMLEIFREISEEYGKREDNYRQKAFMESGWAILNYQGDIFSDYNKVKIRNVGKTSKNLIREYIETGNIKRLSELRRMSISGEKLPDAKIDHEKNEVLELFKGIHGVGEITANDLYDKGCRALSETWQYLTPVQKIGCRWYYHMRERIQREEADLIINKVKQTFDRMNASVVWMPCGSYRRGMATMGDLDILIMKKEGFVLAHYINALIDSNLIVDHLAVGNTKYMGLCRLSNEYNAHRIDLMIVEEISWPYATLYFTGSQKLNISMRDRAMELGLRLNEYRLVDKEGKRYDAKTESDIFRHLQIKYVDPLMR